MSAPQISAAACHNCRRRRLKCDRSIPKCFKCVKTNQECLGYQQLFRWEQGVASRGKMAGKTFESVASCQAGSTASSPGVRSLASHSSSSSTSEAEETPSPIHIVDSLIQKVDRDLGKYVLYFVSDVCKTFVLYDTSRQNHFRALIPLAYKHPVLFQIIVAVSALHMSNARGRSSGFESADQWPHKHLKLIEPKGPKALSLQQSEAYNDAVTAKQRALHLLKFNLIDIASVDTDAALAVILLFIEFDLIDSRHDSWIHHIKGARTVIRTWIGSNTLTKAEMTPLRNNLISEYLVFDILGSVFTDPVGHNPSDILSTGTLSLLQDAEGNHCSSFPAVLLQLVRDGARLSQRIASSSHQDALIGEQQQKDMILLQTARSFDPVIWASKLRARSPSNDLPFRTRIAAAHRAAVCIYLSRVLISIYPSIEISHDLESLVAEVKCHISVIPTNHELFKAIMWPAFIAGAETEIHANQEWVLAKFRTLWEIEPWGYIRGAAGVLNKIWKERTNSDVAGETNNRGDWISELRGKGVDWLIL